ncbi:MAG: hypothetical protein O3A63_00270 [Proteobacteria bacterium]|nr:hypothetical protein [Pseudomonadota bacterium]
MKKHFGKLTLLLTLSLLIATQVSAATRLYRYVNDQGNVVVSYSIPSDRVKYGYEVLDGERFVVIEVIEPQLSDEEAARRTQRNLAIANCEVAMKRVRALYRSLDDIDRAENRAVASMDNLLANTDANLSQLRKQLGEMQERAAGIERQGRVIPETLLESIRLSESQIDGLENDVKKRAVAQAKARTGFNEDRRWYALGDCVLAGGANAHVEHEDLE